MTPFIGREKELARLRVVLESRRSEFVAVYGRRRVGKTLLIRKAFDDKFTFKMSGIANANTPAQLQNFHTALARVQPTGKETPVPKTWFEAFGQLSDMLEKSKVKRKVIFIDELPWFDTRRSDFVSSLEHFWNSWAAYRDDVVLVVCGSAASWMINSLIHHKGGLHNRLTEKILLSPFHLREAELLLKVQNPTLTRYQVVQIYMVTGGIPFYLQAFSGTESPVQNIERICFSPDGLLRLEFESLYRALFSTHERHIAIVRAIATKAKGLTRDEIIKISKLPDAGSTTNILDELEKSGFIRRYQPFQKKKRNSLYQLSDFYTLFYLRFIEKSDPNDSNNWVNSIDKPSHRAWSGYAFEQVCLHHIPQIKKALGVSGVVSHSSAWKSQTSEKGAQIDLLIDRRDEVINLCEMKFSTAPFTINKSYAANLNNKIEVFNEETKNRKAVHLTMITTFGVKQNSYSHMVHRDLKMDVLFE